MTSLQKFVHIPAIALVVLLGSASLALAQVSTNVVSGTATTTSAVITPGATGVPVATVTLNSSVAGPSFVTTLPINVTSGNSAVLGNLSGCQVFNASGTALNTGANILNSVQGTNTVTLDAPLSVSGGTATTLMVRCNLASATPSGGTFQFAIGTPSLAPALSVVTPNLTVATGVMPGAQDAIVANILLDATRSGTPISITSIPLSITASEGGTVSDLSDCRVRNPLNGNVALNTTANTVVSGTNTVALSSAVNVAAGTAVLLTVTCDIGATAANGNTFQVGVVPASFAATSVGSGNTVTPTGAVAGTLTSSGVPVVVTTSVVPTVPGVPDTGSATSIGVTLVLSVLMALAGGLYLRRRIA